MNERSIRELFDSNPDAIVGVNSNNEIVVFNKQATSIFGYESKELFGQHLDKLIPKMYGESHRGHIDTYMSSPDFKAMGTRKRLLFGLRKNGEEFPVDISLSHIESADGTIAIAAIRDISEQVSIENQLRETTKQFQHLFEFSPDATLIHKDNIITDVNQSFLDLFGYAHKDELLGAPALETIILKEDHDLIKNTRKKLKKEKTLRSQKTRYKKKDGSVFYTSVVASTISIQNSSHTLLIIRDLTEQIQKEEQENRQKKTLQDLAASFSPFRGKEFFTKVSTYLAEMLDVDYALVGKLDEDKTDIVVVGGIGKGSPLGDMKYNLLNTPCHNVVGRDVCSYTSGVQDLFPKDQILIDMNIEGYVGCPLFDMDNQPLGIIVLLKESPIENQVIAESTLKIFSERISAEILRLTSEEKLAISESKLASINENSPDLITTINRDLKVTYMNRVSPGYKVSDVLGSDVMSYVPDPFKKQYLQHVEAAFNGENQRFEMKGYGADQKPAWYTVRMSVMKQQGFAPSLLIISTDITVQKSAEMRNRIINCISAKLNSNIDLVDFCHFIYSELQKIKDFPNLYISSYDEANNEISILFNVSNHQQQEANPLTRVAGNGLSEHIIRTKKGLLLNGEDLHTFQKKNKLSIYGNEAKSWVGVPLMSEDQVLGVLAVQSLVNDNAFTEDDFNLLSFIGTQIGSFLEKKVAEKEIKQFERYFSVSMDLLCIANTDGFFTKINPKFSEVLGYTEKELLSKPFLDYVHPDDLEATLLEIDKLAEGATTIDFINRYRCKDGSYKAFLWSAAPEPASGLLYAAARDITEQRKSQNILSALTDIQDSFIGDTYSKESFDKMLSVLLDVTQSEYGFIGEVLHDNSQPYLKTHAITNISWNKETSDFYEQNAPKGLEFKNLKTLFGQVITTGKPVIANDPYNDPRRGGLPSGHPRMNCFMGLPFYNHGKLIGMVGIANKPDGYNDKDIDLLAPFLATCSTLIRAYRNESEKKKVEKEVRKLANIVSHSIDAIISTDQDERIVSWNTGAEKMLGYSSEEILGKDINILRPEHLKASISEQIHKASLGSSIENFETVQVKKGGESVFVSMSVFPLTDDNGNLIGVSRILRDITEQKEAQRIKEEFTEELQLKVKERTMDLEKAQRKLALSLAKEKELGALKSKFVANASHQFRTPLAVIQANIGILDMQKESMSEELKPNFEKVYNRIKGQIDRMTNLMDDVLLIGKINEGSFKLELNQVDILALCEEILDNYNEIQADNRRALISVIGNPYAILLDRDLVGHAFSNLVSNAFKYSVGRPAPLVSIRFEEEKVSISIKDYGIGIPEEDQNHLFEPFYRASNTGEISGTGLGTSISKEYIELNQGTIAVKSEPDKGTEFIITFNR